MPEPCQQPTEKVKSKKKNIIRRRREFRRRMIVVAVVLGIVACFVYFIIPTLFILLGTMWPDSFPGLSALEMLNTNINSAVGIVGLVLAIYSIYYAYETNKVMESQRIANDEFLGKIDNKIDQLRDRVNDVSSTSSQMFTIIDNLAGKKPKSEHESEEQ